MNDVEIESLLEEAGYRFDPVGGRYTTDDEEGEGADNEFVADTLEIPLEDLQRWEAEQRQSDQKPGA